MHIILLLDYLTLHEQQSDWDTSPPAPKDSFDEENSYWDTMIALKKITSSDVKTSSSKKIMVFWNNI